MEEDNETYEGERGYYKPIEGLQMKKLKDVYDFKAAPEMPIKETLTPPMENQKNFLNLSDGQLAEMEQGLLSTSLPSLAQGIATNEDAGDWLNTGLDVAAPILNSLGPWGTAAYGVGKVGLAIADRVQAKQREDKLKKQNELRELRNVRNQQLAKFGR